jgi:hypothetical protein
LELTERKQQKPSAPGEKNLSEALSWMEKENEKIEKFVHRCFFDLELSLFQEILANPRG